MTIDLDDYEFVTTLNPIDVASVRDPGMASLVLLAASMGWNVLQKPRNPVVITSRGGTQKRLPSDTSIRMSVFQTSLSTILAYSAAEDMKAGTPDLIDAIVAITKPSHEHRRRLYLAVGEDTKAHRDRVNNHEEGPKGPREPQPLTTRIEVPEMPEPEPELAARAATLMDNEMYRQGPADGDDHGMLVDVVEFFPTRHTGKEVQLRYLSDSSYQRIWEDDFVDYVCIVCGQPKTTSKGMGPHRQAHFRKGDIERGPSPWERPKVAIALPEPQEPILEWETPEGLEEPAARAVEEEEPPVRQDPEPHISVPPDPEASVLAEIRALVMPDTMEYVAKLEKENQELRLRLAEVEGEFDAFIDMATSRRKRPDGS